MDTRRRVTACLGKQCLDADENYSLTAPALLNLGMCRHGFQMSKYDLKVLPYSQQQVINDFCIWILDLYRGRKGARMTERGLGEEGGSDQAAAI